MNVNCLDRERILENPSTDEWAALEAHARDCSTCAQELRAWESISIAAKELSDCTENPELWPKILQQLAAEQQRSESGALRRAWRFLSAKPGVFTFNWQSALAGALLIALTVSALWFYTHSLPGAGVTQAASPLLRDQALAEVERSEKAYEQAIEKLASQAKEQLESPATPLLASYHEKLLVIDSAIEDLRAQAGMNPSNAHLRRQLLAMYQEKQQTLEEVLEATPR
jgi:hypothetical protein